MAWTLILIGIMDLLIAVHPFIFYPLSLLGIRRFRRKPIAFGTMPGHANVRYAICVCAYNEERVIQRKAENLLSLRRAMPDLEVFIYVDAATDRTAELLRPYAEHFHIHVSPRRHGKTYGMNLLVSMTQAPIIIFTDANVFLDGASLLNLSRYFSDPHIGCVCGHLVYTNSTDSVTATTGSLYWRLEEAIKRLETDTGSTMGADGSLFAIRRELHRPPPDHIIDDMYVSFRVLCEGHRVVQVDDVLAYEESVTSASEEFRRKIRIGCQAFNVHRIIWSSLRNTGILTRYKYVSHKLLRWLSIYFLFTAELFIVLGLFLLGHERIALLALLSPVPLFLLGGVWRLKPFSQIWDVLMSLAGAGLGVWRSLRGDLFQTWTPANSIRQATE